MVRKQNHQLSQGENVIIQDQATGKDESSHGTQDVESDDSMKWEDFFGSSVDITAALLDMYDLTVTKEPKENDCRKNPNEAHAALFLPSACNGDKKGPVMCDRPMLISRPNHLSVRTARPGVPKLHLTRAPLQGKDCDRPLSTSSLSSSTSSSSSSSLPRRDSKKLYLASIESLDDEFSEDCAGGMSSSRDPSPPDRARTKLETTPVYESAQVHCVHSVGSGSLTASGSGSRDYSLSHTDRVILEIIETERTYVQDLQEIIEGYLLYIPENINSRVDSKSLTDLFSNIEDIYKFNRTFLQDLEMCGLDSVAVARCFFKHSYGFAIYTQYCTNYPRTVSVLTELMRNSQTAEIFKERQIALHHNLPLGSYLLKPVQRILRYRLLLENIVKASDKESEGYADIKNALSVMTGIAYHINDMKKRHENAIRVQEIQSLLYGWVGQDLTTYGELVAEGAFRMYRTKTLRHLFLFDKMLLIAKKKEEGILCYKTHIMCSNLMLIESIQGEPLCFHVIPFDNPREQHTFQARNTEQKREWCLQLKRVILENYNAVIPSHARQLVMELGQSKQEDSVHLEKSSSKRQLSAPEYLEKRKQERRKSESSIKPFKMKKGLKKNDIGSPKASPSSERYSRQLRSTSHDNSNQTKKEGKPQSRWRRASVDVIPKQLDVGKDCTIATEAMKKSKPSTLGDTSASDSEKRSDQFSFTHLKGYQSRERSSGFFKKQHNSLPEETTDTENEEHADKMDISFLDFRPPPRTLNFSEEVDGRVDDVGGEYVTFYFANSHVNRNRQCERVTPIITVDDSYDDGYCTLSPQMFLPEPRTSLSASPSTSRMKSSSDSSTCSSKSNTISKHEMKISANYDNLLDLWSKLGTVQLNGCENNDTDQSSTSSPVIRRVHSFTGTEKDKQNLYAFKSFRESSSRTYLKSQSQITSGSEEVENSTNSLMLPQDETKASPVSPSVWLTQQQEHLNQPTQKSVSLPWSFHIGNQSKVSYMDEGIHKSSESKDISQAKLTVKGWSFIPETRAQTLPPQVDVVNDLEKYISSSQVKKNILRFPVAEDEFKGYDSTSSRGSTLYASTSSVNSFHPDHKIYQHGGSKSLSLKNMLSSVSSRLTAMKTSASSPSMEGMDSFTDLKTGTCLDGSNHSINESKIISTKFAHSLGKAYSAILKQKHKSSSKDVKISSPQISRHGVTFHKPGSSVIGARVAYPLDSEYCMLDNFIPLRRDKYGKEETSRPDSLLSASSNMTSSSDSDKVSISTDLISLSNHNIPDCLFNKFAETLYEKSSQSSIYSQSTHSSLLSLLSLPKSPHDASEGSWAGKQSSQTNSSILCITEPDLKVDASLQQASVNIDSNSSHILGESPSDSSDVSGDSYYERTFEAIENALVEEIFRDSAIYSDPDELDLGALTCGLSISSDTKDINKVIEVPVVKTLESLENGSFFSNKFMPPSATTEECLNETASRSVNPHENFEMLFVRRVNRNIIDRLQCLEENHNCQKDVAIEPSSLEGLKSIRQRWKELEKWHSSTAAEKNADSNKETQSVNCFKNCEQSSDLGVDNENSQPKGKGWVKHVVNKLQNETS